ncbi:MAG: TIGR00282 family metallophosphoesterase [Candidatus Dojkabacteria bacterium]|nr:MAG: TIGR00282 family metallophosphoesterase [Candidatus Dojkabacteria bacterium]
MGDICGKPGREAVSRMVPKLKEKHDIDLVMTNIENLAHGRGATISTVNELMASGVDFMTAGNHIWRHEDFHELLGGDYPIIRPINYPDDLPGKGFGEIDLGAKGTILVISLMGIAFMNERTLTEPFRALKGYLKEVEYEKYAGIIVDFHAEATSEKLSAGLYFDGQISALVGSHTHVPTADERVMPGGTAYITDLGMCGPHDSALWVKKDIIYQQNMYPYSPRYEIEEEGPIRFDAVIIDIESPTKAVAIRRINEIL